MKRFTLATCIILASLSCAAVAQTPQAEARYEQTLSPRAISAVQKQLRTQGYYRGRIDGVWGRGTQAALARFQEQHRLEVTAQLNPATAKALGLGPEVVLGNTVRGVGQAPGHHVERPLDSHTVAIVQRRLRHQGFYRGRADGVWGRETQAAVARFQQARGLQVTGHLNDQTARALRLRGNVAEIEPLHQQQLSRSVVRVVQGELRREGFYTGPRDGSWGPRTSEAVAGFQSARGLSPTGQLNPQTVAALGLDPNNLANSSHRSR